MPVAPLISIVDDDASLRSSLENLIRSFGFRAQGFPSAEAFLRWKQARDTACLIVDVRMPGMNGLDLQSHIVRERWRVPIIFITSHADGDAQARAIEAGAVAFLYKPCREEDLVSAIGAALRRRDGADSPDARRPVRLAGAILGAQRHVCAFFNSHDDEYRVLLPFIKDGFDCGDQVVHIIDPRRREEHVQRLRSTGVDADTAQRAGQLDLRAWADAHLRGGAFDQDQMRSLVGEIRARSRKQGFPRIRFVTHMEWALEDRPGVETLLEYEAKANEGLCADPVVCTYDVRRFRGDVVVDVMRTHPMIIIGGILQENPFFVPPDVFLLELRARRGGDPA